MAKPLEAQFQYYLDHQDELVAKYNGRVIVIKDEEVIGVFDDVVEAVIETSKTHEMGTFLVQKCQPELEMVTFHSRIRFPSKVA